MRRNLLSLKSTLIIILFSFIFISAKVVSSIRNEPDEKVLPGEIYLKAKAIHPFFRIDAFPANMEVDVNPPSFLWPSSRQEFTEPLKSYDFQLSQDRSFAQVVEETIGQSPSFYLAKKQLADGTWYWRYRETGKDWLGPYSITVGVGSRKDYRPSASAFVNAVKGDRPRMIIRKDRLPYARIAFKQNGITDQILKQAESYFGVELPKNEWGGKFYKNGKQIFTGGKFPDGHVKSMITAPVWTGAIESLCKSYLLTGEDRYAIEALRWGEKVLSFDLLTPNNLTYDGNPVPDGFDFAMYLNAVSSIYDCLYDRMSVDQRNDYRKNLAERLRIYYEYYCNRLENRCIDNHSWQISLASFVRAAITAKGDIPEADKYLAYAYEIWATIDPEQSRTDGGWFGGGYVGVNIDVWTEVPAYFKLYTGYNFYDTPFYRNHAYYFLYRQSPGSMEDGFSGDGYGGEGKGVGDKLKLWLGVLDADLDLPVAGWLAWDTSLRNNNKWNTFAWVRQVEGMPLSRNGNRELPGNLPQSRDFRDIGVVNMHRDLLHPENDLHVALRSSPFGTFGHNLASHNSFNVIYKGDFLFVPYGHRFGGAKNNAACYRNTRGFNSVLIDGKGQPFSPEAYGWIPRFLDGDKITYACGDASNAYRSEPFEREGNAFKAAGLNIDDHISNGVLKRFRRHVVFLRPSLILVYDELEAKKTVRWDWVLHCRYNMKATGSVLKVDGVDAEVDVRGSIPMVTEVKDKPMFMPINVDGRGGEKAGAPYPIKGTYAWVSSSSKTDKIRILSFVQVGNVKKIEETSKGVYRCGDWKIESEMNPLQMANLKITNTDGSASFLLKKEGTGESVIKETLKGKIKEIKTVDELPYHARGLKQVSNIKNSK